MANRLFDLVPPVVVPDEPRKRDLQAATAASMLAVVDPCEVTSQLVAGIPNASPKVYTISAFAAEVSARRNVRCSNGEELQMVEELLAGGGSVSAAEYTLWNGISEWDPNVAPSLQNVDVATAATGTTVAGTLANVINAYSALTVLQSYIIHLGIGAALELSALGYAYAVDQDGQLVIRATGAPVVVSPYYPSDGVALTGSRIDIEVGPPQAFQTYDSLLNRTNITGLQLLSISFDPSTSVRAV